MIKLLTHNDLDGVGCYILSQLLINDEVDVEFCTHQTIEEKMSEAILQLDQYEKVYITDIHFSLAYVEQFFTPEVVKKIRIFDHHQTGAFLNQYAFAQVTSYYNNRLTCGTELFFNYLTQHIKPSIYLTHFVELVRSYDTWDWFADDNQESKSLNDLLYIKGINAFSKQMVKNLMSEQDLFSEVDKILLDNEHKRIEKYIKKRMKELQTMEIQGYQAGIISAECYFSELGNEIVRQNSELDFVAIISHGTISYRTNKDNVNVAEIAKKFGGGGHSKAAGSPISKDIQQDYYKKIFQIEKEGN